MTSGIVEQAREIRRQLRSGEIQIEADRSVSIAHYYYNRELEEAMTHLTCAEVEEARKDALEYYSLPIVQKFDILSSAGCVKRVKLNEDLKSLQAEVQKLGATVSNRDRRLQDANDQLHDRDAEIRRLEHLLTTHHIDFGTEQGDVA